MSNDYPYKEALADKLKKLREKAGFSQKAMINEMKVNLSQSSLSAYEKGTTLPSLDTLWAYAQYFKVDIYDLISDAPIPLDEITSLGCKKALETFENKTYLFYYYSDNKEKVRKGYMTFYQIQGHYYVEGKLKTTSKEYRCKLVVEDSYLYIYGMREHTPERTFIALKNNLESFTDYRGGLGLGISISSTGRLKMEQIVLLAKSVFDDDVSQATASPRAVSRENFSQKMERAYNSKMAEYLKMKHSDISGYGLSGQENVDFLKWINDNKKLKEVGATVEIK